MPQWHHVRWETEDSMPDGSQSKGDRMNVSEMCDS